MIPGDMRKLSSKLVRRTGDVIILGMFEGAELSGYDVISLFHKRFHILVSSGTIYSILYALERQGVIRGEWRQRKRVYTLTKKGVEILNRIRGSRDPIIVSFKPLIFQTNRKRA